MTSGAPGTLSRAGEKLAAALDRFALRNRVHGALALDVGASTGGFVGVLLDAGARAVTAVEVGREQLHTSLRGDARVTSIEGVDIRKLPLDTAEGPFDFFTVDVSFMGARNTLRPLAFRLRPGAEGVVLVKPQFELPEKRLRAHKNERGGLDDEALRRDALARLMDKAAPLGFALVATAPSPVPGESGTVELLAHLRFAGRTDKLPDRRAEGQAAAPTARAASRPQATADPGRPVRFFAVAAPGLEDAVQAELRRLPSARDVRLVEGGCEFEGDATAGLLANLLLASATRVLARVGGEVRAREFAVLRHRLAELPWERFVRAGQALVVSASASRCRLYHTGALGENVEAAIADRLRRRARATAPHGDLAPLRVLLRGVNDRFSASVDTSGDLLHKRGWRLDAGAAPLRETLAAGLLHLAGWRPGMPLADPMCGSGTIAIEAALRAAGRAPGAARAFAIESWPGMNATLTAEARRQALAAARADAATTAIFASDARPDAVAHARANAERAGVAEAITFAVADAATFAPPPGPPGLVLTNPPYGHRLRRPGASGRGPTATAADTRALASLARRLGSWRLAVLTTNPGPVRKAVGLEVTATHPVDNGGLRATLLVFAPRRAHGGRVSAA